jgi:hypothetical protein
LSIAGILAGGAGADAPDGAGAADTSMVFSEHASPGNRAAPNRIKAKAFDFLLCILHSNQHTPNS